MAVVEAALFLPLLFLLVFGMVEYGWAFLKFECINNAAGDPSLRLDQVALPPGEVATRNAIARTKTKELLKPFNSDFEWYLLLTQAEALSYGWHLAVVAAGNVQRRERAIYLTALGDQLKELYQQTVALMKARAAGRPKTTKTTP